MEFVSETFPRILYYPLWRKWLAVVWWAKTSGRLAAGIVRFIGRSGFSLLA